jgi:hypothetical protein
MISGLALGTAVGVATGAGASVGEEVAAVKGDGAIDAGLTGTTLGEALLPQPATIRRTTGMAWKDFGRRTATIRRTPRLAVMA